MTLLDASNELYKWFQHKDYFKLSKVKDEKDDFNRLLILDDEPALVKLIVRKALEEFDKEGLVRKVEDGRFEYWVLMKSFDSFQQNITIDPGIALAISAIVNKWCEVAKDDSNKCKASNITPKDLQNLIGICFQLSNQLDEK